MAMLLLSCEDAVCYQETVSIVCCKRLYQETLAKDHNKTLLIFLLAMKTTAYDVTLIAPMVKVTFCFNYKNVGLVVGWNVG